ncbi:hypothetical protein PTSG_02936 [Salpingoeca rosetta]|uniref:Uncharacterized protein n=1 Tax=Salpingoeca rosetta (strain ATCC 50818 / BSB-021) TaxID=946362 RepID=F2U3S2_SALR5|nr:uncharacterized protein PTSG_02936 [Salpingoeca rosetta]EGD82266.1 hypothetical protein PTSG_02936 [Salpingoeca rosetta]|eukprot:XP_004996449.1 hypothetical protein PTSG_02936 [Salpingoeca rosetta]
MSSRAFWHNLLKLSGELAKVEDAGACVVPLVRAAGFVNVSSRRAMWNCLAAHERQFPVGGGVVHAHRRPHHHRVSGKNVAQLLLGVGENKSVVIMLVLGVLAGCGHGAGGTAVKAGWNNLAGWTAFRLLLLNDNTLSANGLAARWWCWLLRILCVISMVLNRLIALTSDGADIEFQLLRG